MLLIASDFAFDQTSNQPDNSVSGSLVKDDAPPWQEVETHMRSWDTQADNPITRKDS
jgi:hypothetical protein